MVEEFLEKGGRRNSDHNCTQAEMTSSKLEIIIKYSVHDYSPSDVDWHFLSRVAATNSVKNPNTKNTSFKQSAA